MFKHCTQWMAALLLVLGLGQSPTFAQRLFGQSPAKASLITQQTSIQPGSTFTVGVLLTPNEGWHTYWVNPGQSGLATKITWELPQGFSAGPIQWPTPHPFVSNDVYGLGYPGPVLLTVDINAPKSIKAQSVTLKATAQWLVCKEACVPGRAKLSLTLPIKSQAPVFNPAFKDVFERNAKMLPKPLKLTAKQVVIADGKLTITVPGLVLPHTEFFSVDDDLLDIGDKQQVTVSDSPRTTTIQVPLSMYAPKTITRVQGVIVIDPHAHELQSYGVDVQLQQ